MRGGGEGNRRRGRRSKGRRGRALKGGRGNEGNRGESEGEEVSGGERRGEGGLEEGRCCFSIGGGEEGGMKERDRSQGSKHYCSGRSESETQER